MFVHFQSMADGTFYFLETMDIEKMIHSMVALQESLATIHD